MRRILPKRTMALAVVTPALTAGSALAAPQPDSGAKAVLAPHEDTAGESAIADSLKSALFNLTPDEKFRIGGDSIMLADRCSARAQAANARSWFRNCSGGPCCSPSVRFNCVKERPGGKRIPAGRMDGMGGRGDGGRRGERR
jgi:hypothetical protein